MHKNLILFTVWFPYGIKETFLESEIEYLSRSFEKVTIIPSFVDEKKREVPVNVEVDIGFAIQHSSIKLALWSLVTQYTYKEIIKNPAILFSVQKLQRLLSFTGRGVALFRHLKKKYGAENIFYSYWINGAVFASFLYNNKVQKIDYVTRAHRGDLYLGENKDYLPLRPEVFKNIKKIFSISQDGYAYLLEHYPLHKAKLEVSRLGTEDQGIHTSMSISDQQFYLVSCSYIHSVKRIDLIIKSLSIVARDNSDMTFIWTHIGSGIILNKMKTLAKKTMPINVQIKFVEYFSNQEVFNFYGSHDIDLFINTSSSEGIPVTFMEAMSCSIPVMALNVGGVSEIVNNKNGILLEESASYNTIAKALDTVVKNKFLLEGKKKEAKEFWQKHYDAKHNYKEFAKTLASL